MELRPEDLDVDIVKPSGVRITHLPSGKVAYADDGRNTIANRDLALARLRDALEAGE